MHPERSGQPGPPGPASCRPRDREDASIDGENANRTGSPAQDGNRHEFRPDRLTFAYAFEAAGLFLRGLITWHTLKRALRDHPAAVCGKGSVYVLGAEAKEALFGPD